MAPQPQSLPHLTDRQLEILDGCLLGDGHITVDVNGNSCFKEDHGMKQRGYLEWLAGELDVWFGSLEEYRLESNPYCRLAAKKHPIWTNMRHRWYNVGNKIVPTDLKLTPLSVAVWHCGDGSNSKYGVVILSTHGFTKDGVDFLSYRLKDDLDIETTVILHKKRYPKLYVRSASYLRFIETIKPHITCECMQYKIAMTDWVATHRRNTLGGSFLSPEGILFEMDNTAEFAKDMGLNKAHLCSLLQGNLATHKGWTCPGVVFTGTKYLTPPDKQKAWRESIKAQGLCAFEVRTNPHPARPGKTTCELHSGRKKKKG